MNGVSFWQRDHSTWLHSSIMSPKSLTLLTLQQPRRERGWWEVIPTENMNETREQQPIHNPGLPLLVPLATGNESDKDQVLKWLLHLDRPTAFSPVCHQSLLILLVNNICLLKMLSPFSARYRSRENCTVAGDLSASARICIKFAPV